MEDFFDFDDFDLLLLDEEEFYLEGGEAALDVCLTDYGNCATAVSRYYSPIKQTKLYNSISNNSIYTFSNGILGSVLPSDVDIDFTQTKKKRPRRFITKPRVPRLLNRDIRKSYGRMMTNVFNSSDAQMVWSCFAKFCHTDSVITHSTENYRFGPSVNSTYPNGTVALSPTTQTMKFHVQGARAMAEFFIGNMLMVPDLVIQSFQSEVLHRKGDKRSKVRIFSTITGTRTFDIPINVWMPTLIVNEPQRGPAVAETPSIGCEGVAVTPTVGEKRKGFHNNGYDSSSSPPSYINNQRLQKEYEQCYIDNLMSARTPLATPFKTSFQSTCTLSLDENNCITEIEICRLNIMK